MRDTSFCASAALETSRATMRRSRIPEDAGSPATTGECSAMLPSICTFYCYELITAIHRHIFRLDQINADTLYAITEIEHPGGTVAQVHNPVSYVRSPIIDPNDDPLAVLQVRYLYETPKREFPVGGCEFEHIEVLAAGRGLAVELLAIPGGSSYLVGFWFSL